MVINLLRYHNDNPIILVDRKIIKFILSQQKDFTNFSWNFCMEQNWAQISTGRRSGGPFLKTYKRVCQALWMTQLSVDKKSFLSVSIWNSAWWNSKSKNIERWGWMFSTYSF